MTGGMSDESSRAGRCEIWDFDGGFGRNAKKSHA